MDPTKIHTPAWEDDFSGELVSKTQHYRALLGGPLDFMPYVFVFPDGGRIAAENAGLEGFFYTLSKIIQDCGHSVMDPQTPYMCEYLALLARRTGSANLWRVVGLVSTQARHSCLLLLHEITPLIKFLRTGLVQSDKARWIRTASMYQIFVRAFNVPGLRKEQRNSKDQAPDRAELDYPSSSLEASPLICLTPGDLPGEFDAIRWTGVYPIGEIDVKGTGGGSPFAIRDHSKIDPKWGSQSEIEFAISTMKQRGVKTVFELLPNHTSADSILLEEKPELFIHRKSPPLNTEHWLQHQKVGEESTYWIRRGGYDYDGERYYWDDTLQLDISNPMTVDYLIQSVCTLRRIYGVDGFRVDMAYQLLNEKFSNLWNYEMSRPLGTQIEDEFLYKLIWGVKSVYPEVGFVAEGFDSLDRLSAVGFDVVYSKNEMTLPGGIMHQGWYNALETQDSEIIADAVRRASFLHWQAGGAAMLAFVGHHDLPSPMRAFGQWAWGASFLTLLLPTSYVWYNGTEVQFEAPCEENGKMITFNRDVKIDWSGFNSEWHQFIVSTLDLRRHVKQTFGEIELVELELSGPCTGYLLNGQHASALVLANLADHQVEAHVHVKSLQRSFQTSLGPKGPQGVLFQEIR